VVSAADERRGAWCRPTLPHGDREREVQGQGIVPFQELALLSPLPFLLATSSFNLYSLSLSLSLSLVETASHSFSWYLALHKVVLSQCTPRISIFFSAVFSRIALVLVAFPLSPSAFLNFRYASFSFCVPFCFYFELVA
jgi:hypothetical protein